MKKLLITGGSGFIGQNLKAYFSKGDFIVLTPPHHSLPLEDEHQVEAFFSHNVIDYIIHTAVKPYHRAAIDIEDVLAVNLKMYFNLVKQMRKYPIQKMLVTGSGSEYGLNIDIPNADESLFGENIPEDDGTFSRFVMAAHIEETLLPIYNMRLFGVFGKHEDYRIRFISNAICKVLLDIPISLRQDRVFSYVYIDDFCRLAERFLFTTLPDKTYHVTPDKSVSLLDIADRVRRLAGKPEHEIRVSKSGRGLEYAGSNARLKNAFPDFAFMKLDSCILDLIKYYRMHLDDIDKSELLFDR